MLTRVISGAVLLVLALTLILTGNGILAAVLMLLSLSAFHELANACGLNGREEKKKAGVLSCIGYIGTVVYYLAVYFGVQPVYWMGIIAAVFLAMMAAYVFSFPKIHADQLMIAFFCFIYGTVLFAYLYLTRNLPNGVYLVWLIFISSWVCDTFAYFVGVTMGKHRLAPILSPKKSIEGAIGGIIGSALAGALYGFIFMKDLYAGQNMIWICALICTAGAVISQIGDLAASGIKRNHGIKDYGKLIPGHGGIMDRFDSVLFTAPIIYYLAILMIHF